MTSKNIQMVRTTITVFILVALLIIPVHVTAQTTVDLVVHSIEGRATHGVEAYDVAVTFALFDSAGNPIKDAAQDTFAFFENGQQVEIGSLAATEGEAISVALVLDTSYSMLGDKIAAARDAAVSFITSLEQGDQVAVITFDSTVQPQIDFTTDTEAARQQVELIDVTPGGATCLYDAAYQAVQQALALPGGERAIVLLTDGVDEKGGQRCSLHTEEEVIALVTESGVRIPIYTIGLESQDGAQTLQNMASSTNGRYQYSPSSSQVKALFERITDVMRSQYVLHYTSQAGPGEHQFEFRASYRGAEDSETGSFRLPELPYTLSFTTPAEGSELSGAVLVSVEIEGEGQAILEVRFEADGTPIGTDATVPYSLEWDPGDLTSESGQVLLEAVALAEDGSELGRNGISLLLPVPVEVPVEPSDAEETRVLSTPTMILIGSLLAVILAAVVIAVVVAGKKRKAEKERDRRWQESVQGAGASAGVGMDDRTMDAFSPSEAALGVLVILQSDDPTMIHQRIEITKSVTTLGRKADNDVIFAKDGPVSRHHAVIEERAGQLFLSEVLSADETGISKRPAYGTFVNGTQVDGPIALQDGDKLQLGKRLQIAFEAVQRISSGDDRTMDQFTAEDDEKTMDFGATQG